MTASPLRELNSLVARQAELRCRAGDPRDKERIADEVLRAAGLPDLAPVNAAIREMIERHAPLPSRVLP